jgi:tripeptidyl-peptidase-1
MKPQLGLLGLLCSITAATANLVEVERLSQVPSGWTELGPANAGQTIRLSIALALNNEEAFATKLQQVSDPSNSQYGSHLSRDEALALVRPQQTAIDVTRNWLVSQDVKDSQIQDRGLFLDVFVTVAIAEKLLSTKYNVYEKNGRKTMGAMAYSVPDDVRPHITSIQPTTFFQSTSFYKVEQNVASLGKRANGNAADASTSTNRRQCLGNNTPACLRRLYRMNNRYQEPHPKSLLGIVGFNYASTAHHVRKDASSDP